MAKAKVQTSRKRVNQRKQEIAAPDEVTTALHKLGDHLNAHLKKYLIGLAALLVVALGVQMVWDSSQRSAVKSASAAIAPFVAATSTVGIYKDDEKLISLTAETAPDVAPVYADEKTRWEAILGKMGEAKSAASGDVEDLLGALEGRARLATGNAAEAATALDAFLDEAADSPMVPVVLETRGNAALAAGDKAGAAGFYEKLSQSTDTYYKVRGQVLLGDLYADSDASKARKHYDAALATLVPADGQVLPAPLRGLRAEITRRRALIGG